MSCALRALTKETPPSSVPVSREHRRAKTDRLDTELLKRAFLGWLRGEPRPCSMAKIPTPEEEDATRPNRERETLVSERHPHRQSDEEHSGPSRPSGFQTDVAQSGRT